MEEGWWVGRRKGGGEGVRREGKRKGQRSEGGREPGKGRRERERMGGREGDGTTASCKMLSTKPHNCYRLCVGLMNWLHDL